MIFFTVLVFVNVMNGVVIVPIQFLFGEYEIRERS